MKRFEIWLVRPGPVLGSEIGKTRPGVIVSPDEANDSLRTVLIAPLTSVRRAWPTRLPLIVNGVEGDVALDPLRAVDKRRLASGWARCLHTCARRSPDACRKCFAFSGAATPPGDLP